MSRETANQAEEMPRESSTAYERPAIAGSGAIAVGLAACATISGDVLLLARSDASAWRAEETAEKLCAKIPGADSTRLRATTDLTDLTECDLVAEAIVEDFDTKVKLHTELALACPEADLATTTSSLGIAAIAGSAGVSDRFYGLHVFNPVAKMDLVELCLPAELADGVATRARAFCEALGKRAVEVPDVAGFVVNRLLFAYLFDAVRLLESGGLDAAGVDDCMKLGAGHPLGPLALLDFVGLDVAVAIGESLQRDSGESRHEPPPALRALVAEGKLGRKSGAGFFSY